ncbi:hypothetical protein EUX98_g1503 [Antrodiella citrinella]|uniref:Cytochrome P450 n=1 Tax=Antrodiella citrinella TaxID=2447956 RepID=A0A4S4N1A7_9APHY|nr:hypothetical protein EUX98_g1503 [Antrodiella citrinella]
MWRTFGPVVKLRTFLGRPMLYVYDPKALHHIVIKDQYIYEETPVFLNVWSEFALVVRFVKFLLASSNPYLRIINRRGAPTPTQDVESSIQYQPYALREAFRRQVSGGPKEIEVLHWLTRLALELIGQGGLGHSFDTLEDDTVNPLAEDLKNVITMFRPFFLAARFMPIERLARFGSGKFRRWIVDCLPSARIRRCIEIVDHLNRVSTDILVHKKAALASGELDSVDEGKDLMSVLLKANTQTSEEDRMSDAEFLGHMSSLMFAAMETTSGALARILDLLAQHPDVQEKLRQELAEARGNGDEIEYDRLVALPYLEAVCRESLRVHSPTVMMSRTAREDVVLPLSNPIKGNNGAMMNEISVPKGTNVTIGILASNCNEELWGPDALEWKPERWLKPLPDAVTDAHIPSIYSNLMTFLGGGRACIGFKFSQMEMKIVLSVLLETFKFSPSDKDVQWNLRGLQSPTVGESPKPQMPLMVELISKSST